MYYRTSSLRIRLQSSRRSGRYWEMHPALEQGLNDSPYNPVFEVESKEIIVTKTLFWKELAGRGYFTYSGFEEFRIPRVVVEALGIKLDDYYPLFVGWAAIGPAVQQEDKTHRLEKVILVAKQGLDFPHRRRWALFDEITSAPANQIATQGHLTIFSLPYKVDWKSISTSDKEILLRNGVVYWLRERLFFNHIIYSTSDHFGVVPKNNSLVLVVPQGFVKVFSWEHHTKEIVLKEGVYLLTHPFPRKNGVD